MKKLTVAHLLGVGEVMGLTLDPNGVIDKEVVNNAVKSNARHYWPKTEKSNYNVMSCNQSVGCLQK